MSNATRQEVVSFIQDQFERRQEYYPRKDNRWHYGLVELKELLDFIYGGAPKNEKEAINVKSVNYND